MQRSRNTAFSQGRVSGAAANTRVAKTEGAECIPVQKPLPDGLIGTVTALHGANPKLGDKSSQAQAADCFFMLSAMLPALFCVAKNDALNVSLRISFVFEVVMVSIC
tara:strand:- start:22588 stop:22908 length:321 start_codon:yes stop_codon:yes gene_type:complete